MGLDPSSQAQARIPRLLPSPTSPFHTARLLPSIARDPPCPGPRRGDHAGMRNPEIWVDCTRGWLVRGEQAAGSPSRVPHRERAETVPSTWATRKLRGQSTLQSSSCYKNPFVSCATPRGTPPHHLTTSPVPATSHQPPAAESSQTAITGTTACMVFVWLDAARSSPSACSQARPSSKG